MRSAAIAAACRVISPARRQASTFVGSKEILVTEPEPQVALVSLNRPQKRNTFTADLWRQLREVFDRLGADSRCRAVVLAGEGRSFCAGIDLAEGFGELVKIANEGDVGRRAVRVGLVIEACQESYSSLEACPKPVIAAVHSHCLGAGINLVASADVRYATQDAVFSIKEVAVGLTADVGVLNRIRHLVGSDSLTRELAFSARDFGADEALRYGLVNRLFATREQCVDAAVELAAQIAKKSPLAVRGTKLVLNHSRDHSTRDSLEFVRLWNQAMLQSNDLKASAQAVLQKKTATYEDL